MDDEVRRADEPRDSLGDRDSAEYRDELFDEHVTGALEGIGAPVHEPRGAEPAVPQTTEWFSVEDYLALEDEVPALPRREHHVTAVVVSHDGAVWLPAVLTTLAAQTRLPDAAVGVDTGSVDASPDLLLTSFGADRDPSPRPHDRLRPGRPRGARPPGSAHPRAVRPRCHLLGVAPARRQRAGRALPRAAPGHRRRQSERGGPRAQGARLARPAPPAGGRRHGHRVRPPRHGARAPGARPGAA